MYSVNTRPCGNSAKFYYYCFWCCFSMYNCFFLFLILFHKQNLLMQLCSNYLNVAGEHGTLLHHGVHNVEEISRRWAFQSEVDCLWYPASEVNQSIACVSTDTNVVISASQSICNTHGATIKQNMHDSKHTVIQVRVQDRVHFTVVKTGC